MLERSYNLPKGGLAEDRPEISSVRKAGRMAPDARGKLQHNYYHLFSQYERSLSKNNFAKKPVKKPVGIPSRINTGK